MEYCYLRGERRLFFARFYFRLGVLCTLRFALQFSYSGFQQSTRPSDLCIEE